MHDVIFYEAFREEAAMLRSLLPPTIKGLFTPSTIQAYGAADPPAGLISTRTQSTVPSGWTGRLKGVLTRSTGYEHILMFRQQGGASIPCGYLPDYCARSVAEQAVLLMLALFRKLPRQMAQMSTFNRDGLTGTECRGRRLLVIGVGRIGAQVVDIGRALRMEVKGVDREPRLTECPFVELAAGLMWCDAAVCCLPLTPQTQGWLNYATLQDARPGMVLVNIARGEITPLPACRQLLQEGRLGGLALDVYPEEGRLAGMLQKGEDTPALAVLQELQQRDNVILTPHNAFNTREALLRKAGQSVAAVRCFLEHGHFPDPVPDV